MTSRPTAGTSHLLVFLVAALGGAAAGGGVAIVATAAVRSHAAPPDSAEVAKVSGDLQQLAARVDQLDVATAAAIPNAEHATGQLPRREPTLDQGALNQLEARVTVLEQQLRATVATAPAPPTPIDATGPVREPLDPIAQAEAQRRALLDPTGTTEQKLGAWRRMRNLDGSWDDASVAEMVRLGITSMDPAVRADVWRQADSQQRHDALVPALLQALQTDADAKVREEAAETLENYCDRPGVLQALDYASRNDADAGVRRFAAHSIEQAQNPRRR